jgi:hypothetical protein
MDKAPSETVKVVFDRLRAQLCGQVEALGLPADQAAATKRLIKDRTSEAWNALTALVTEISTNK